ncbi:unnamed protein product [Dibothriocephalus latus]|uniref:Uncharacterized protein n=1 Tax=Dibothriocephalus latus TaxID=60516 RepID=A0A3P7LWP0_DIBLA|nr:unnamed protein product [Dibothriocephalus latus]
MEKAGSGTNARFWNGTSTGSTGQPINEKQCHSPRPPPLISKFRGEPPDDLATQEPQTRSKSTTKMTSVFSSLKTAPAGAYYIINPEWASESKTISHLGLSPRPAPLETGVHFSRKSQPTSSGRGWDETLVNSRGDSHHGILPEDRGNESFLSAARRANSQNPVWPHRCKSAPSSKRSRNPISWV